MLSVASPHHSINMKTIAKHDVATAFCNVFHGVVGLAILSTSKDVFSVVSMSFPLSSAISPDDED